MGQGLLIISRLFLYALGGIGCLLFVVSIFGVILGRDNWKNWVVTGAFAILVVALVFGFLVLLRSKFPVPGLDYL